MLGRILKTGTCLSLLLLAAVPIQAQESSWGLRVFAHGGVNLPLRNLGKNAVEIEQQSALQVVANVESSPTMGGGLEFLFPDRDIRIRGQIMTTIGATAKGVLGLCESGELAVPGQGLCSVEAVADARIIDGDVELVFVSGQPARWVRPILWVGFGFRKFDFDSDLSECDVYGGELDQAFQICRRSRQIYENPGVNPIITFGVGLEADRDPLSAFLRLSTVTGSYSGGIGIADGGRQMDLALTAGLAFRVR